MLACINAPAVVRLTADAEDEHNHSSCEEHPAHKLSPRHAQNKIHDRETKRHWQLVATSIRTIVSFTGFGPVQKRIVVDREPEPETHAQFRSDDYLYHTYV